MYFDSQFSIPQCNQSTLVYFFQSIKKLPTQNPEKSDIDSKESSQKNLSCRRKDKIITKEKESIKLNDFEDFTCNDKDSDSDLEPYAEMEEINYDHFRHGHKGEDNNVANKKNIKTTSQDFASKRKQVSKKFCLNLMI